jgi:membrane protein DedA with SNARE-associated domain
MQTVFAWITQYGYPALFTLLLLGLVGLPVPDETLLTFCGYLIYTGRLHFGLTLLAGFLGSICGISISFVIGLRFGRLVLDRYGKFIQLTPERLVAAEHQFRRFGPCLLTVGYFLPGVRHFTAIVAGITGLRWSRFVLFAYVGAGVWISTFLTLGYVFGERWQHTSELVHRYLLMAMAAAAVILLISWLVRRRQE